MSDFFREKSINFSKSAKQLFDFLLDTFLGEISVFTYLAGSILGGERVEGAVGNHLHPF